MREPEGETAARGGVVYRDLFNHDRVLDGKYGVVYEADIGALMVRGSFRAVGLNLRPVIDVVAEYGLREFSFTSNDMVDWAMRYVALVKERLGLIDLEQSTPFVSCFARLIRWVSSRFREFYFYRPARDGSETVIFCRYGDDLLNPVAFFYYPRWSLVTEECLDVSASVDLCADG